MTDKFEVPRRYTALNDVTGDLIKSKTDGQDKYSEGWDRIFGKPHASPEVEVFGNKKEVIEEFKDFPVEVVSTTVVFNPDSKCRVSVGYNSWNEHCVGWNSCYHCDNGYYPCNQNCMLE